MKYVHIIEMRLEGKSLSPVTVATAVLDGATVRIDGDSPVAKRLRERGVLSAAQGKHLTVDDGEAFLAALAEQFRSAYLLATGVLEGSTIEPYQLPPMQDAA